VAGASKVATAGGTWFVSGGIADAVTCLGASCGTPAIRVCSLLLCLFGVPAETGTMASFIVAVALPATADAATAGAAAVTGAGAAGAAASAIDVDVAFPLTGTAAGAAGAEGEAALGVVLFELVVTVAFGIDKNSRGFDASANRRALRCPSLP